MPTVLISPESLINVHGPWVAMLEEAGFEIQYPEDSAFARGLCSEDDTVRIVSVASAVIAGGEVFTPGALQRLSQLRVIARSGVGYDRIDVAAATGCGILVTITPNANHESVAEHVFALLLGVAKAVVANDAKVRAGRRRAKLSQPIRGKTLGIFGLGRIGRSTATRGLGMRMNVIATEMAPDEQFVREHDIELVDFDTLLARSDYLSIHCPLNEETTGLFNREVFARMKEGSVLINTARGKIVVEADLIEALKTGPLLAAGLDVYEQEPATPDNPLFKLDNIVVSPHVAGVDTLSKENMAIEAADCIIKLHRGEWPVSAVVNDDLRQNWKW